MRQRRRKATTNDPISSKVHRREGNLATVQIKSVIFTQFRLYISRVAIFLLNVARAEVLCRSVNVWLLSRSLPARGRVGLEVHRCLRRNKDVRFGSTTDFR